MQREQLPMIEREDVHGFKVVSQGLTVKAAKLIGDERDGMIHTILGVDVKAISDRLRNALAKEDVASAKHYAEQLAVHLEDGIVFHRLYSQTLRICKDERAKLNAERARPAVSQPAGVVADQVPDGAAPSGAGEASGGEQPAG